MFTDGVLIVLLCTMLYNGTHRMLNGCVVWWFIMHFVNKPIDLCLIHFIAPINNKYNLGINQHILENEFININVQYLVTQT